MWLRNVCLSALGAIAVGCGAQVATNGSVAPTLNGAGAPTVGIPVAYTCSANLSNVLYIQTDAVIGRRLWICNSNSGTYAWENVVTPMAVATTAPMSAVSLALGGCTTATATIAGATVGTNAAYASPLGQPTSAANTAGLVNVTAWVSAANTVTVSVCATGLTGVLTSLTTAAVPYKVQLY